jgi:hypothetical protein
MMSLLATASRRSHPLALSLLLLGPVPLDGWADGPGWDGVQDRDLSTWELQVSPYTYHYSKDPAHTYVWLVGLAKIREDGWLAGGAYFRNTFGQPSGYGFVGRKYVEPWGYKDIYWSWTAGVIYGYKPPYEDKVPLNYHGFSPGFIPTVGYQVTPQTAVQITFLGTAGLMFNFVYDFGQGSK